MQLSKLTRKSEYVERINQWLAIQFNFEYLLVGLNDGDLLIIAHCFDSTV